MIDIEKCLVVIPWTSGLPFISEGRGGPELRGSYTSVLFGGGIEAPGSTGTALLVDSPSLEQIREMQGKLSDVNLPS